MSETNDNSLLLFDGDCSFCNRSIQFIYKRDPKGKFRFASLQSETGQSLLKKHNLPLRDFDTMVLIENGSAYTRSTAALRVAKKLSGLWPLMFGFIIVPPFIRNFFYNLLAKNRHRLVGKKPNEACEIPSPDFKSRFLS